MKSTLLLITLILASVLASPHPDTFVVAKLPGDSQDFITFVFSLLTDDFDLSKTQDLGVVGSEAGVEEGRENADAGLEGETGEAPSR